jgi:hypothetical protein
MPSRIHITPPRIACQRPRGFGTTRADEAGPRASVTTATPEAPASEDLRQGARLGPCILVDRRSVFEGRNPMCFRAGRPLHGDLPEPARWIEETIGPVPHAGIAA